MGAKTVTGESQRGRLPCGCLHGPDLDGGGGDTDDSNVAAAAHPSAETARIGLPSCMREGEISLHRPSAAPSFHLDTYCFHFLAHLISLSLFFFATPTLLVPSKVLFPRG